MAIGVLDFLVAIPLARICRLEDPASISALSRLPLSMIAEFGVPLAFIAYFILGAQLWRVRAGLAASAESIEQGASTN
jgi:hypothetical protein